MNAGHPVPDGAVPRCRWCARDLLQTPYGELCAACLFASGLDTRAELRVGPYELLQAIDVGGTCTVHIGKHTEQDGLVAIKLAHPEVATSPEAIAAFRNGIRIQMALRDLPNIVSTYDLGTHEDGRPYSVMPLLAGGTLAEAENLERFDDPEDVIALMIELAGAVELAHDRCYLHCDLKPENVLFGPKDEPFVSDFGLGRVVGESDVTRATTFVGGTRGWMSPEQVLDQELTTASDVFSLGVMLYFLLTRRLPFGNGADFEARVVHDPPEPLREYRGVLGWELDQICARAMQKRPEHRYRSAAELAEDLVRARSGLPIEAERRRPMRRATKWMRRHKIAALAGVELCMLLLYLPLMPISVFREVKSTIREQIHFIASAQAGAVMNELRAAAQRVEQLARDPEVRGLVNHGDPSEPPPALIGPSGFDGLSVFSAEGTLQARSPKPTVPHSTLDFAFRDYFRGQRHLRRAGREGVYVARAHYSMVDEHPILGLSAPLYEGERYVGALLARTRAKATFGAVQMNCGGLGACMTALLGPRDRDQADAAMPGSLCVLAAPGLAAGRELMLDQKVATRICARLECRPAATHQFEPPSRAAPLVLDDYADPMSGIRSMAALAPVGRTGLIVVVAAPDNALVAITKRMTDRVKAFLWVPVLVGVVLLFAVLAGPRLLAPFRARAKRR